MNKVIIKLETNYESVPPLVKIDCCNKIIFNSLLDKNLELEVDVDASTNFFIEITKSGKTLDLVKKNYSQSTTINQISLNGIDLKINAFGKFKAMNNPYIEDHTLTTSICSLNGVWRLDLPSYDLIGQVNINDLNLRDKLDYYDIACFGCYQTYGIPNEESNSWPRQLELVTGKKVGNFSIQGSLAKGSANINQITSLIMHYFKNQDDYPNTVILLLPHCAKKQIVNDKGLIENTMIDDESTQEYLLHGEEHLISQIAVKLYDLIKIIEGYGSKFYFSTYYRSEYDLWSKTQCRDYMLPYMEFRDYPTSEDYVMGHEYCEKYAKMLKDYIDC